MQGMKGIAAGFAVGIVLASGVAYATTQTPIAHIAQPAQVAAVPESATATQSAVQPAGTASQQATAATTSGVAVRTSTRNRMASSQHRSVASPWAHASQARTSASLGYRRQWHSGMRGALSGSSNGSRVSGGWGGGCR